MKPENTNKFKTLYLAGLSIILIPLAMLFTVTVLNLYADRTKEKEQTKEFIAKEKRIIERLVIEKIYVHDTVRITCNRKHCDNHGSKSFQETLIIQPKLDTI